MPDPERIRTQLDAIVAEMDANGMNEVPAPPEEAYHDMGAFGTNTMAFPQWLKYVLVPIVTGLLESDGPWPATSMVATHAVREFDGIPGTDRLCTLLAEFDALFGPATE
ncbi:MAG TPA: YqcC family protein [Fimbriimonadaceae bacterium]|nr:YqcC family protein [Fimbriimonadaceae bacterium]